MHQLLVVTLIVTALFSCCSCNLIDANGAFDSAHVGELCKNAETRIEHISSIGKLLDHFESSTEPLACRDQWLEPLRDLKQVLEASAQDACSLNTANKIEEFQWSYIVGTLSRSWRDASSGSLPEPLRLFFMHFVDTTVDRCRSEASQRLEQATGGVASTEAGSLSKTSLGALIDALSIALVPQSSIKKFDDFFFIFNSIFMLERRKGKLGSGVNLNSVVGDVTYASVKMHDATRTNEVKTRCGQELRPVYSNTVLPVMKLIDLGYGGKGEKMNNKLIANWYGITQLCELILPINFYSSETMKKDQYSIVEREEAKALEAQTAPPKYPENIQVQPTDLGDTVSDASNDHISKNVRSNFRSRARIYRKTLKHTFASARSIVGSRVKSIFFHRRSKDNNDNKLASSLDEGHKMLKEDEQEESVEDDHSMGHLIRHKREPSDSEIIITTTVAPKDERNIIERLLEKKRVRYCIIALLILLMAGLIAFMVLGITGVIGG